MKINNAAESLIAHRLYRSLAHAMVGEVASYITEHYGERSDDIIKILPDCCSLHTYVLLFSDHFEIVELAPATKADMEESRLTTEEILKKFTGDSNGTH